MPDSDPLRESGSTHLPGVFSGVPSAETPQTASSDGGEVDTDPHDKGSDPNRQRGMIPQESLRFAGAGLELAGSTIVLATLGYWLDRKLGNATPIAMALGGLLGFAAGMLRFVRLAMDVSRRAERSDRPGLALAKARTQREAQARREALAAEEGQGESATHAELEALAEAKANFDKIIRNNASESIGKADRPREND